MIDARTTIAEVCEDHGVTLAQIYGRRRDNKIVTARHAIFWYLFKAGYSQVEIGHYMHRDSTTVWAAISKMRLLEKTAQAKAFDKLKAEAGVVP